MELTGTIEKILNKEQVSDTFVKRSLVLKTNEAYPQKILVEFIQEKVSLLDMYKEGTDVKININIRGREWTDRDGNLRYFNSINGWRIEPLGMGNSDQNSSNNYNENRGRNNHNSETDDLPF